MPNYEVKVTQFGPWPLGHVFSDVEFKRQYPLPDNQQTRDAGLIDDGEDAYHQSLIQRHLDAGSIALANPEAKPEPTPLGPESMNKPKVAAPKKDDDLTFHGKPLSYFDKYKTPKELADAEDGIGDKIAAEIFDARKKRDSAKK